MRVVTECDKASLFIFSGSTDGFWAGLGIRDIVALGERRFVLIEGAMAPTNTIPIFETDWIASQENTIVFN
ncbi:hypothetical protein JW935_09865 [candidate division KSB1 bacterium]|nr:hypothetical protein [candidate division KSB1 bacterium]